MICTRCGHQSRLRPLPTANGHWLQRCDRCGTSHSCSKRGVESVASPPLAPVATPGGGLSPWFDARYQPYRTGVFDCEFTDGTQVRLAWNGRAWTWTGKVVDTSNLLKWRGKWTRNE